jgi:hypothetical protein
LQEMGVDSDVNPAFISLQFMNKTGRYQF